MTQIAFAPGEDIPHYVVERGESLWTIAEMLTGNGKRWPELAQLNSVGTPFDSVPTGTKVWVPFGWTEVVLKVVDYVFSRPVGTVEQEIAGSMVTLYGAATALGVDAQAELDKEIIRINTPEVKERCRRRQAEKRAAMVAEVFTEPKKMVPCGTYGCRKPKPEGAVFCDDCYAEYREDPDAFK